MARRRDGVARGFSPAWRVPLDGVAAPQRNVIGVLPGSDAKLADTYVLVTAHYDGQGTRPGPNPA